jgi:hypothetical protein
MRLFFYITTLLISTNVLSQGLQGSIGFDFVNYSESKRSENYYNNPNKFRAGSHVNLFYEFKGNKTIIATGINIKAYQGSIKHKLLGSASTESATGTFKSLSIGWQLRFSTRIFKHARFIYGLTYNRRIINNISGTEVFASGVSSYYSNKELDSSYGNPNMVYAFLGLSYSIVLNNKFDLVPALIYSKAITKEYFKYKQYSACLEIGIRRKL